MTTYDRCGKEFLRVIEEHGTESRLVKTLESSREVFPALSSSTKKTFELCALGLSLAEIAEHRSLTEGTVSQHISEMISKGVPVNTEQFVSPEHQAKIRKALSLMKRPDFRRLREILGEEIGYAEIRIMVAVETRNRTMGGA